MLLQSLRMLRPRKKNASVIQETLHRAAQRLSLSQNTAKEISREIPLEVLADDELIQFFQMRNSSSVCSKTATNSLTYIVRLETVHLEGGSKNDWALLTSIVFYNYGIAFQCLSATTSDLKFHQQFNNRAMHMLQMACSTLSSKRTFDASYIQRNHLQIQLISLLVLQPLSELSTRLGYVFEGKVHLTRISQLLCDIDMSLTSRNEMVPTQVAHAA